MASPSTLFEVWRSLHTIWRVVSPDAAGEEDVVRLDGGPGYVGSGARWGKGAQLKEVSEASFECAQLCLCQQFAKQTR